MFVFFVLPASSFYPPSLLPFAPPLISCFFVRSLIIVCCSSSLCLFFFLPFLFFCMCFFFFRFILSSFTVLLAPHRRSKFVFAAPSVGPAWLRSCVPCALLRRHLLNRSRSPGQDCVEPHPHLGLSPNCLGWLVPSSAHSFQCLNASCLLVRHHCFFRELSGCLSVTLAVCCWHLSGSLSHASCSREVAFLLSSVFLGFFSESLNHVCLPVFFR